MRKCIAFVLVLGILVAADAAKQDTAKEGFDFQVHDQDRIQGTWAYVSVENGGKLLPPEELAGVKLVFKGDKLTLTGPGLPDTPLGTFKLDPTKNPKWMDITNETLRSLGIYALTENELRMCHGGPGHQRPTELASKPGTSIGLVVLKREQP
jgi:uncharacterized protein (TIGR03067 family)